MRECRHHQVCVDLLQVRWRDASAGTYNIDPLGPGIHMHGAVREYAPGHLAASHRVVERAAKLRALPQTEIRKHSLHLQVVAALVRRIIPGERFGGQANGIVLTAGRELVSHVFQQSAVVVMPPFQLQGPAQFIVPQQLLRRLSPHSQPRCRPATSRTRTAPVHHR